MMEAVAIGAYYIAHAEVLRTIVRQLKGVNVAVLGDPMLDYYHFGHVDRLSPEAPVPVFIEDKMDLRDGGAANVAANLAALGCRAIQIFPPAPYTMKHRYLVGAQQLFRIDRDKDHSGQRPDMPPQGAPGLKDAQALVISDYGKGWCSTERCQAHIREALALDIPVVVDPKGLNWAKYAGATIVCPNQRELIQGYDEHAGHILHKQGAAGMTLIYPDRTEQHFDARARQVFDVTGAGDTVVAVLAAALAVRAEIAIGAELANIAAGVVVGQVGTTPCSAELLLREIL
jgi:D-beta-D-heptose 7-phosphate kinase/D-beta-D-heptose 1-phosphate adenosyltransferase